MSQAKELGGIIHLLRDYVEPTHELFSKLYKEGAQTLADEALAEEQAALLAEEEALREEEKILGSIGSGSSSSESDDQNDDYGTSTMSSSIQTVKKAAASPSAARGSTSASATVGRRPSVLKYSRKIFSTDPNTSQETSNSTTEVSHVEAKDRIDFRDSVKLLNFVSRGGNCSNQLRHHQRILWECCLSKSWDDPGGR